MKDNDFENSVTIHYIKYQGVTGHRAVACITYPPVNGDESFDYFLDLNVEDDSELCNYLKNKIFSKSIDVLPSDDSLDEFNAMEIRSRRDYILSATDYLIQSDYPLSEEQKSEIRQFRQLLRDIPQQSGFPENVVWPTVPDCIKDKVAVEIPS